MKNNIAIMIKDIPSRNSPVHDGLATETPILLTLQPDMASARTLSNSSYIQDIILIQNLSNEENRKTH